MIYGLQCKARLVVISLAQQLSAVHGRLWQLAAAVAQKVEHQPEPAPVSVDEYAPLVHPTNKLLHKMLTLLGGCNHSSSEPGDRQGQTWLNK